jgi:hypothetical protein
MCHVRILLLAGCLGILAVSQVEAQPFHEIYGRSGQPGELTSVAPISTPGAAIASGNFDVGSTQGVLLKVQPTGKLDWVRAYGPTQISSVRESLGGRYAWIGTTEVAQPRGSAPVVVEVEPNGIGVLWARVIRLLLPDGTPAVQAFGRFLEIDRQNESYWVGGEVWFHTADQPQPWLAKLDGAGNLLWAKTLSVYNSARFHSIFPAYEGGIIGVGERLPPDDRDRTRMLAIRLGENGDLKWAFDYRVTNSAGPAEQRLADLDRDPRYREGKSAVVGTVAAFCKSVPSAPCDRVDSAAFVAILDESNGALSNSHGLVSTDQPKTFGETIVQDLTGETIAVGGEVEKAAPGERGLLALLSPGLNSVRKASFHDSGATFDAGVRSLDRWRNGFDRGYLFMMNETHVLATPARRRSLVKTDRDGNTGACEENAEVKLFDAWTEQGQVPVELRDGRAEPVEVQATTPKLEEVPCNLGPGGER